MFFPQSKILSPDERDVEHIFVEPLAPLALRHLHLDGLHHRSLGAVLVVLVARLGPALLFHAGEGALGHPVVPAGAATAGATRHALKKLPCRK